MRIKVMFNDINSIAVLFSATMSFYIVLLGANSLINTFAYGTSIDSMIVYGIYAAIISLAIIPILQNAKGQHWLIFIIFVVIALFGCVLNSEYISKIIKASLFFCSFFLVGATIQDNDRLEHYVGVSVIIATIFGAFHSLFSLLVPGNTIHDMTAAYSLLPTAIMSVHYALSKKKIFYYTIFIVSFLEIAIMGVRGPILIYFIALAIITFKHIRKGYQKLLLIAITSLLIVYITSERYLLQLKSLSIYLSKLGITNSAVRSMIQNAFFDDDGRASINEIVIQAINSKPLFGHGIFYDRVLLDGGYTHNIYTEMLIDFGYVFGTIVFFFVLWRAAVLLKKTQGNAFRFSLIIMIISLSLGQNMVSGSYLENEFFFLLLGMSCNQGLWNTRHNSIIKEINR